jgi:predicted  nucleic acid-binding Zn-ribbon protein
MRNTLVRCADRIAKIDGEVSDALRNAMNASSDARDANRLDVRIASLKRDQAAGPILAELKGISDRIYGIREKVRLMDKRMQEARDPQKEIEEAASALGVKASGFKVAATTNLLLACGGVPR